MDAATHQPVADLTVIPTTDETGGGHSLDDGGNVSDATGRFTVTAAASGSVTLTLVPRRPSADAYGVTQVVRAVSGAGPVDVGDVPVTRRTPR